MNAPAQTTEAPQAPVAAAAPARCPNCREPLLGEFCYACGQPRKGFIRHLSGIVADFLDTIFNIDSRTFQTLFPLFFRPGFLSIEYFEGRRVRYVTPLRLYFFISVLAFLAVSWVTHIGTDAGASVGASGTVADEARDPDSIEQQRREALDGLELARAHMGEAGFLSAQSAINQRFDRALVAANERATRRADLSAKPPTADPRAATTTPASDGMPSPSSAPTAPGTVPGSKVSRSDSDDLDGLKITIAGEEPWDPSKDNASISWLNQAGNEWVTQQARQMVRNAKRAKEDPGRFFAQAFSLAPQTLFFLLPIFAILLKLVYLFKRRLYMEHLIVALHSHSFLCLSILLLAGLSALRDSLVAGSFWQPVLGTVKVLLLCWIPLYLLLAQKRIYRQGWFFTLFNYLLIGTAYSVLISLGMAINMMLSLAWL
jgi:hypothetical protein